MTLCLALPFPAFFPGLDQPLDKDKLRFHHVALWSQQNLPGQ